MKIPCAVLLSAWALWHDLSVHHADSRRVAGPTYQVGSFETELACQTEQRVAMAREALPREGPHTERLADGIKVWDTNGRYYTTFRYLCWPVTDGRAPFR
jgi:hypothetical protein